MVPYRPRQLILVLWTCLISVSLSVTAVHSCPTGCSCGEWLYPTETGHYLTNCSHAGLRAVPGNISTLTTYLDLSFNNLASVPEVRVHHLRRLKVMDTRGNLDLRSLPVSPDLVNLSTVYTDSGYTCCIYETEWEKQSGSQARKRAKSVCQPTEPYIECHNNLTPVISLVIYSVTALISLLVNPWVMVVSLGFRPRRKDPILMNNFHFCCSNILITIYAAVIFGHGVAYYGDYPYHMESWLNNAGCSLVGYLLISGMLAEQFFWMIQVIAIYMKLRHPLNIERHVTNKQLWLYTLISWALSFFIAAIPFMTQGNYNRVGLCLPFYSGDEYFGFKYVILYTVITNITLAVNITLALLLLRSFIENRKKRYGEIPEVIARENKMVEKMILVMITVYIILDVILVVFLIMSCVGGTVGKVGREWFARLCVLSAVLEPLAGPVRRKRFYKDTVRLLQKWNCYKWDHQKHSLSDVQLQEKDRQKVTSI